MSLKETLFVAFIIIFVVTVVFSAQGRICNKGNAVEATKEENHNDTEALLPYNLFVH